MNVAYDFLSKCISVIKKIHKTPCMIQIWAEFHVLKLINFLLYLFCVQNLNLNKI